MITVYDIDRSSDPVALAEISRIEREIDIALMRSARSLADGSEAQIPLGSDEVAIAVVLAKYPDGGWIVSTTMDGADVTAIFRRAPADPDARAPAPGEPGGVPALPIEMGAGIMYRAAGPGVR